MRAMIVLGALLGVGACSSGGASGDVPAGGTGGAGGELAISAAAWNVADACTILKKEDVAAVVGTPVESTELGTVSKLTDQLAGFSTCHYALAGGKRVAFMARQSPEDDNTPEAMKTARDQNGEMMGGAQDVPGLGKSAFWLPKVHELVVFVGENRYLNVTVPAATDAAAEQAQAVALAKKVM